MAAVPATLLSALKRFCAAGADTVPPPVSAEVTLETADPAALAVTVIGCAVSWTRADAAFVTAPPVVGPPASVSSAAATFASSACVVDDNDATVSAGGGTGPETAIVAAAATATDTAAVSSITIVGGVEDDEAATVLANVSVWLSVGEAGSGGVRSADAHATPTLPSASRTTAARSTGVSTVGSTGPVLSIVCSWKDNEAEAVPVPSVAPSGGIAPDAKSACWSRSAR